MEQNLNDLCLRIERLEKDLSSAKQENQRLRDLPKRPPFGWPVIASTFVVILAASWTLRAQTPSRMPGTAEEQILSLLQRVTALERRPPLTRVKAPFEVVDDAGKVVFRVQANPRGFQLLTAVGQVVATGFAWDTGGIVKTYAPDQSTSVGLGVIGKTFAGMVVKESEKPRALVGIAADGRAIVEAANNSGTVVAHLGQSAGGNGMLQLTNGGGFAQVEAGVLPTGAGVVRTYPNGNPGAGLVGMPGTFIMGRTGK